MPADSVPTAPSPYETLKQSVYDAGLYEKRSGFYFLYAGILFGGFALSLYALTLSSNLFFQLANAIVLAIISMHIGYLGHDIGHGQLFSSPTLGKWIGSTVYGFGVGVSLDYWYGGHNEHHKHTNQIGKDPDINLPLIFSEEQLKGRSARYRTWVLPYQHLYFFFFMPLAYLNYVISSIPRNLRTLLRPIRFYELVLSGIHFAIIFWCVFHALGMWEGIIFLVVFAITTGAYAGYSFAPNHKGEEVLSTEQKVTYVTQVTSTRNISGGPVVDILMGGLNLQIEHHLFPNLPRPNLRKVKTLVKSFCEKEGIPYKEVSLFRSAYEMYTTLRYFATKAPLA